MAEEPKTKPATLDLEWKALEESIVKLSTTVWRSNYYDDSDDDGEEDKAEKRQGSECRPKNAEIMSTLLSMLKDKCGDRVPFASTSRGGTVTVAWTNLQTHSRVTCSIRVDSKGHEIDISKYPTHGDPVSKYFPLPITKDKEESIGNVLMGFLRDISL